jgi:prepilin-type N-terminal cleavage/methylation domain-containing protein
MTRRIASRRTRQAFTLIEVMVAMAIVTMVAVATRAMFEAIASSAATTGASTRAWDHAMNAERHLRALAGRAVVDATPQRRFVGAADSAAFASYCEDAGGWLAPCRVSLFVRHDVSGDTLVLQLPSERVAVTTGRVAGLRFLVPSSDADWLSAWESGTSLPLAIGVAVDGATLLLRIGTRG